MMMQSVIISSSSSSGERWGVAGWMGLPKSGNTEGPGSKAATVRYSDHSTAVCDTERFSALSFSAVFGMGSGGWGVAGWWQEQQQQHQTF